MAPPSGNDMAIGVFLGTAFVLAALGSVGRLVLSIRLHRIAWGWKERVGMLVFSILCLLFSLVAYMPDGSLIPYPSASDWPYGPGRRTFGACGMVAGALVLLAVLVDTAHSVVKAARKGTNTQRR